MNRLTRKQGNGSGYQVDIQQIQPLEEGYAGPAVERLAKLENLWEDLEQKQKEISQKLEQLRGEGRTKSAQFRELMGKKLSNSYVLALFKDYEIDGESKK